MNECERRRYLVEQLNRYSTLAQLRSSQFFSECSSEIESLIDTPEVVLSAAASPRLPAFLRVVQWNIEKGKRLAEVLRMLEADEVLKWADVILMNEADFGMNRSGNRHVAREIAGALGMHMAFAPACIELTKGTDDELHMTGENRESLQGNAVLSRYMPLAAHIVRLPPCFEPFEFHEKRFGGRNCLWVRLQVGAGTLWIGCTHLEVRNTPACRARQMRKLVTSFPGKADEPVLLGGDFNTSSFRRGSRSRTFQAAARLMLSRPATMKLRLLNPESQEALFSVAGSAGLSPLGLNSAEATATTPLETVEEAEMIPAFLAKAIRRRLAPYQGHLCFKLDWFFGRGLQALRANEIPVREGTEASRNPGCRHISHFGHDRISDHSPIHVDLRLPKASS